MSDESMYSEKARHSFIRDALCQKDAMLYKYYQRGQVQKFRRRLGQYRDIDKGIKNVVQTYMTDATRDVIIQIIKKLTLYMKPFGDLVISGGEAFNAYLDRDFRIVTTDVDTKFTPQVLKEPEHMFGFIQYAKLFMWDKLGQIVTQFDTLIRSRIKKLVTESPIGKFLGVSFPRGTMGHLHRRYTLLKKSRAEGTLIDIELFAIDLPMRFYVPSLKKISTVNIGGLLDVAFMRPKEFGFEASHTRSPGLFVRNPITGVLRDEKSVLVASGDFLLHDLYALQKYNLRPDKKEKDRARMYVFCKHVLDAKVTKSDSMNELYRKSIPLVAVRKRKTKRPPVSLAYLARRITRLDPYKYESVTTVPEKKKVVKYYFYGLKGSNGLTIPGYAPTNSKYRFNVTNGKWVKNSDPLYIHNEANYRPVNISKYTVSKSLPVEDTLYGYNPTRDKWMPPELVRKAAMIPLVGLKISSLH